jgi:hypothetical protein
VLDLSHNPFCSPLETLKNKNFSNHSTFLWTAMDLNTKLAKLLNEENFMLRIVVWDHLNCNKNEGNL